MGLDQYLQAKKYLGGWEHSKPEEKAKYNIITELVGLKAHPGSPHIEVEVCVGYWRKANQIHDWFVEAVQEGRDECQASYVSRSQLRELLGLCKEVKRDPKNAENILPPSEGFFFGSQDIDEYYMSDIDETINIVERALELDDSWSIYYQASW